MDVKEETQYNTLQYGALHWWVFNDHWTLGYLQYLQYVHIGQCSMIVGATEPHWITFVFIAASASKYCTRHHHHFTSTPETLISHLSHKQVIDLSTFQQNTFNCWLFLPHTWSTNPENKESTLPQMPREGGRVLLVPGALVGIPRLWARLLKHLVVWVGVRLLHRCGETAVGPKASNQTHTITTPLERTEIFGDHSFYGAWCNCKAQMESPIEIL